MHNIENSLQNISSNRQGDHNLWVDEVMEKFVVKVFDSLTTLERDIDDKLISSKISLENDYYLYSNLRPLKISFLDRYVREFKHRYESNLEIFTKESVTLAYGKISEYVDAIQDMLKSYNPEEIPYQVAFSYTNAKKILNQLSSKDVGFLLII